MDQNSLCEILISGGFISWLGNAPLTLSHSSTQRLSAFTQLQDLQNKKGETETGRKQILQYTIYASVDFAIVQVRFSEIFKDLLDIFLGIVDP